MEVTNNNITTTPASTQNPNGILGKDDFLNLLLVELQNQDPTDPMDSDKILSQTSELASLEASTNTNKALEDLTAALGNSLQFSTISAIGKIADTGSNAIVVEEGKTTEFQLYFANDVSHGSIDIMDVNGNTVDTIALNANEKGVQSFTWDGKVNGELVDEGLYYVTAHYSDSKGESHETRVGTYPIESVRFDEGEALVKLGSSYVPFDSIKEVYEG